MTSSKTYISITSKIAVGALFIVSALLKLSSIDNFELYIFSFELLSLDMAALAARFVIGAELVLGIAYIANIYHKQLYYTLLATMAGFSLFLLYLTVIGREDNCHCFGDLVDISPLASLLKNAVIIALVLLSKRCPAWRFEFTINDKLLDKYKSYVLLAILAFIVTPFVRYPHHALYNIINDERQDKIATQLDIPLFNQFIEEHPEIGWGTERKIIAFYGPSCKYCRMSAEQISQIIRRNNLSSDGIQLIFWGTEQSVEHFFEEANAVDFNYMIIEAKQLLDIVKGAVPTLLYYDEQAENNITIQNIRSVQERDFTTRLKKE